jgi:hypothetical protein
MIGRAGVCRATVVNPDRLKVDAVPVKRFAVLPGAAVSTGYASSAGAFACFAARNAAAMRADATPRRR